MAKGCRSFRWNKKCGGMHENENHFIAGCAVWRSQMIAAALLAWQSMQKIGMKLYQ